VQERIQKSEQLEIEKQATYKFVGQTIHWLIETSDICSQQKN
jgi:hypothetical protein